MKTRIFLLSILMWAGSLTAFSQGVTAKSVLDKCAAKIGRAGGAKANFTISSGKNSLSGTICIKGNKYYATTPQATVWFDGKTQWAYMKNTDEVNISTPTAAQQSQTNPLKFITIYKNGYKMDMKTVGSNYEIHLTSTQKGGSIQEMYIHVNKASYLPSLVKIRQGSTWSNVKISGFQAQNQNDAIFKFNPKKYPKAEIIDLR